MRVAILSDKLVVSGGAERYLLNLMQALLDAGDTVDVYTTKVGREFQDGDGLRIHRLNLSWCPRKLRHPFFEGYLKRRVRDADYDMVLGMATPYSPDIALCVGTFLGDMLASKRRLCNPLNWLRVASEKRKYRGARHVVAPSSMQNNELRRLFGVPENKLHVLPPPIVGFGASTADADATRRRYQLEDGVQYFIFVSNSHRRKGLETIVRAFDRLGRKDCRVLVAGAGRGRFPDRPYLQWLGFVDAVADLYPVCTAALLPARYEPFGQVVTEALLSGLPVFVSDRVGAAELMGDCAGGGRFGWVVPCDDAVALEKALRDFLERPFRVSGDDVAGLRASLSVERHVAGLKAL